MRTDIITKNVMRALPHIPPHHPRPPLHICLPPPPPPPHIPVLHKPSLHYPWYCDC